MKNLLILFSIIVLISCKKSEDPIPYSSINVSAIIWKGNTSINFTKIDSCRFDIYNNIHDLVLIKSVYTDTSGLCNITVKGGEQYYFVCISPSYKNSSNSLYHYECAGKFSPIIKNNFVATFLYDFGTFPNGSATILSSGSTNIIYNDPINY